MTGPIAIGFIDVGFLRSIVAAAVGTSAARVRLDAAGVVDLLSGAVAPRQQTLLRSYWYDGQHPVDDPRFASQKRYFDAVAATPGIQLRLGTLAARTPPWQGELVAALAQFGITKEQFSRHFPFRPELTQKGVDTLMVLDMLRLAQAGAYASAIVLSGDRDICEAVRLVGELGKHVTLFAPTDDRPVAPELRHLVDQVVRMSAAQLRALDRGRPLETADGKDLATLSPLNAGPPLLVPPAPPA